MVILRTNHGDIQIKLDFDHTPNSAKNFLDYVETGFYDGTLFHRVIDGFMIQGGGFDQTFSAKETREPIENEADKSNHNKRGTIAMARTMDPHSATAQFFINVSDNEFLNFKAKNMDGWGYCVFGEVVDGMDVVDKIKSVKTGTRNGHQDVPNEDVIIEKACVTQAQ